MKHLIPILAAVLGLSATSAQTRDAAWDRAEILRVEAALCRAFEQGDVEALRNGLDPTFTLTDSHGAVTDLADNLAEVERRDPVYSRFRNHGQLIRLYGDAAVVTGITTLEGHSGGTVFSGDFQFTDTWVYRDGGWKMAASHASRLPAKR